MSNSICVHPIRIQWARGTPEDPIKEGFLRASKYSTHFSNSTHKRAKKPVSLCRISVALLDVATKEHK